MSTKLTGYVWDGCAASGMKLSSVAIMARLADFSNDEGVCWPSIETIARQIGAGMSTVRTAIARLEAEGWLTRKARRQGNGGVPSTGDINIIGGCGGDGQSGNIGVSGEGGTSYWGGGGRAGAGGGVSGKAYGSGGGGAYDAGYSGTSMTGGKGAAGICIIEEFA